MNASYVVKLGRYNKRDLVPPATNPIKVTKPSLAPKTTSRIKRPWGVCHSSSSCGVGTFSVCVLSTVASDVALRPLNFEDRKSTRLNSSHQIISYAVFCLKKKKNSSCE